MTYFLTILLSPVTTLSISLIGILASILGVMYNRNLNEISQQQYELDQERFLAELARQGPLVQIAKSNVVYSIETSGKPESKDVLQGKIKGYRHKMLFRPETRINIPNENSIVRLKEIYLDISLVVSNVSDVPIKIEEISIRQKFRPEIRGLFRWIGFLLFDFTSSSDLHHKNYFQFETVNDKAEASSYYYYGLPVYLNLRWMEFCERLMQISHEKKFISGGIEFIDEKTLKNIRKSSLVLPPKSKRRWRIKIHYSKEVAREIFKEGFGPKDIVVLMPWEGDMIRKYKNLEHVYVMDSSPKTPIEHWIVGFDEIKYY